MSISILDTYFTKKMIHTQSGIRIKNRKSFKIYKDNNKTLFIENASEYELEQLAYILADYMYRSECDTVIAYRKKGYRKFVKGYENLYDDKLQYAYSPFS